jgi:hypothetical protein
MIIIIRIIELSSECRMELVLDTRVGSVRVFAIKNSFNLGASVIAETSSANIEPSVGVHLELKGPVIQLLYFLLGQIFN